MRQSRPVRRLGILLSVLLLAVAACGGASDTEVSPVSDLPRFDADDFALSLATSPRPTVVNVWASWCPPCRAEAPLFVAAFDRYGDRVAFVGVDVEDTQHGAKGFIAEYGIPYGNLFDPDATVRARYGGSGVPVTYFFAADGTLVSTHYGVIDEQALALSIDELIRTGT